MVFRDGQRLGERDGDEAAVTFVFAVIDPGPVRAAGNELAGEVRAAFALGFKGELGDLETVVIVIATLPILIVFPFFQKTLEKGMMAGAVKE